MTYFQNQVAQVVRNTQSSALPCGDYQYRDTPYIDPDIRALEAQFYARIIKEYGSIEAYNQREE
jgi:hypothetical protein